MELYQLSRANSTYKETQDLIRRIIILTMETGTLTGRLPWASHFSTPQGLIGNHLCQALAATADLVIFLGFPQLDVHITFTLTLAKLYSNSLLVALNSRVRIPGSRGYKPTSLATNASADWNFTSIGLSSVGRSGWDTTTDGLHGENRAIRAKIPAGTQDPITLDISDEHNDASEVRLFASRFDLQTIWLN